MSTRTYLAFLPWLVFAFIARATLEGVAWGGVAAALAAAFVALLSFRTRSAKLLELFAIVWFAAFAVAGALDQHDPTGVLQRYHNPLATGGLVLFAMVSLAVSPFTESYAREIVPRKYWNTERFRRANVELTRVWVAVFVAIAASQAAAGAIGTRLGSTIFNWILPVGIFLLGVKQASVRWNDQFDEQSMGLDAMFNQTEFWDASLLISRETSSP